MKKDLVFIGETLINSVVNDTPFFLIGTDKGKTAFLSAHADTLTLTEGFSMLYHQGQSIPDNGYIDSLVQQTKYGGDYFLVIDNAEHLSENQWNYLVQIKSYPIIVIGKSCPEQIKQLPYYCVW